MPHPDDPREEALKSLDERLAAFEAERAPSARAAQQASMGRGYRFLGEVVGGVLGGLGIGWLVDHFAGTGPLGLIGGLLIGIGASTFAAINGARTWAKAESERAGSLPSVPDEDD